MWKVITRGIRESLERRVCRTNVFSQSSQENNNNSNEYQKVVERNVLAPCFSALYHGYCGNQKHFGTKNNEYHKNYDAKYTWTDAVSWSSFLAVGYVVCQSLCINRKLFEIDNTNFEKWRTKIIANSQIGVSKLFSHLFVPQPKYILPVSREHSNAEVATEILIDKASTIEQLPEYGPITAEQAFEQAVKEFSHTHDTILGELELNCGSAAIEEERYTDAIEHFTAGANLSSVESTFNLALCYELGLGTSIDYTKAAKYYKEAAERGHADAMYNLGVFLAQGRGGLETNLSAARQLFKEAAKKGQVQALKALQLEKSFKIKKSKQSNKFCLEIKPVNNTVNRVENTTPKFISYKNLLMTEINEQQIETDEFKNSYNITSPKNPTEMFLDMLGVHERSAVPLISVGNSGV